MAVERLYTGKFWTEPHVHTIDRVLDLADDELQCALESHGISREYEPVRLTVQRVAASRRWDFPAGSCSSGTETRLCIRRSDIRDASNGFHTLLRKTYLHEEAHAIRRQRFRLTHGTLLEWLVSEGIACNFEGFLDSNNETEQLFLPPEINPESVFENALIDLVDFDHESINDLKVKWFDSSNDGYAAGYFAVKTLMDGGVSLGEIMKTPALEVVEAVL